MSCDTGDFRYPMQARIYYPTLEESAYGATEKIWHFDRMIPCSLITAGSDIKEEINPDVLIDQNTLLVGRVREDLRTSSLEQDFDITNIIVTGIVDRSCKNIYKETSGPREGLSTLFEVATTQPFIDPFGKVEFYRLVLRRLENQGVQID